METITFLTDGLNKPFYIKLNISNYKITFKALGNDIESIVLSFEDTKENPDEIIQINSNTVFNLFNEYDLDHKKLLFIDCLRNFAYTELPIEKEHFIISAKMNKELMKYKINIC